VVPHVRVFVPVLDLDVAVTVVVVVEGEAATSAEPFLTLLRQVQRFIRDFREDFEIESLNQSSIL